MAERAAHNRPVGGSSPPAPTIKVFLLILFITTVAFTQFTWHPYELKEGGVYTYSYRELLRGEVREGWFTVALIKGRQGINVRIRGRYHRWEGSLEESFRNLEELSGYVLIRMYTRHWLIPLGRTVLSRGLVKALRSYPGDWSFGERKVAEGTVRRVVPCREGGLEGRMLEVEENGEGVFKLCVHPDIPLPIYMFSRDQEGNWFEARIRSWTPRGER